MEKILRNVLPPQPGMATFARLEQVVIRGGMRELYVFRPIPEKARAPVLAAVEAK